MLDQVIRGGMIVDGTGAPARRGDIGIRDGVVVAVGEVDDSARAVVDADGLVVAPGFIDPHTHYDAQLWWDPLANPSNVHGVTTVIAGNCGFTLAPVAPDDVDYTSRMMARVEGMSLTALQQGVSWRWKSFAEFLDGLDGNIGVNAGFMVGHCAIRRWVMGPAAVEAEATADQIVAMAHELHRSIEAGGLGLSTTRSSSHSDGDGLPVPSRVASRDELFALCRAVGEHPGTVLEAIVEGCNHLFSDEEVEVLAGMSIAARRPLNWNVLTVDAAAPQRIVRQRDPSLRAAERGGRVVALTMPTLAPMNMSLRNFCAIFSLPGWGSVLNLPVPERMLKLRDPAVRAWLLEQARSPAAGVFARVADFDHYVVGDVVSPRNAGLAGRVVADIAAERGQSPFDTFVDIALEDELRTVWWPTPTDDNAPSWEMRRQAWDFDWTLLGGSDAGAHLDRLCGANYPTAFLADVLRGRRLVTLERAVQLLSDAPAREFGLQGRGRIAAGWRADIVAFDPDVVGSERAGMVADLPGGGSRLTSASTGVARVMVNGVTTVVDGRATGETPGTVLRSGRDTVTSHAVS
ncbi:MAG TPA: amidohydrolase family protein [Acidimicrobiales bacterium]|jgi:N-acyl-D-aspartate/D-glutamate deacylase|nr:amidohydrolase family protein [Acidimicrobiales bacterium]